MPRRYLWIFGMALAVMLAAPRDAAAGFLDFIYEMSGPQFVGFGATCRFDANGVDRCGFSPFVAQQNVAQRANNPPRAWFAVEPAFYWSTDHHDEKLGLLNETAYLISMDSMFETRSFERGGFKLEHGVGVMSHFFFGRSFDDFTRAGLKLRPVRIEVPLPSSGPFLPGWKLNVAYNIRLYWDAVTPDDFKPEPGTSRRPFEASWIGFTVGLYPN